MGMIMTDENENEILEFCETIPPCNECGGNGILIIDKDKHYSICCNQQCPFGTKPYEDKLEALSEWKKLTPSSEWEF